MFCAFYIWLAIRARFGVNVFRVHRPYNVRVYGSRIASTIFPR